MKNKGFTLIELLAVIVILAIIAIIATPMILGVIERAKKGSVEASALGYVDAVEKQIAINQLDSTKELLNDGIYSDFNVLKDNYGVIVKGEIPKSGWIQIKGGQVIDYSIQIDEYVISYDTITKKTNAEKDGALKNVPTDEIEEVIYKCKRATELHTEECTQTENYCFSTGYTTDGIKGTATITYGNLGVTGILTSGDAFDCDVDGDGVYGEKDETTGKYIERFYYVTDLESNNNYAVLIYYNNTTHGVTDNTNSSLIAYYDLEQENWHGPKTAITNLPAITQWSNVTLSNTSRTIINEIGKETTDNDSNTIENPFNYNGYAARLLTTQEIEKACNITVGSVVTGELDNCIFLMENTHYSSNLLGTDGYWLENPRSTNSTSLWHVGSIKRYAAVNKSDNINDFGVRPAIEVLKNEIQY